MFKSTLSLCLGYFLNNTQLQVSFIWQRRLSALFVYVPMNPSRLSMSLSRLPPCIICRFSHLVIWEELTDREETGFQLQPSDVMGKRHAHRVRQSKQKLPIHFTILPVPLRIPPCENYQSTPSLPPLSCVHKCLIWISLAPLPSNCLGPKLRPAQSLCADAQSSERTRGIKHTKRDCARGTEEWEGGQQ